MGTTIVATALIGRKAYIASVGDSRAYLVHKDEISQITQDHSFVGEQIRAGLLTKEQARVHPQRNVITRALGSQAAVQVDTFEGELADGDILILCTDGLTGHIPEDRIRDAAIQLSPQQAVHQLIELAKEDGGTDNISMILLRMGPPPPVQTVAAQAVPAVRPLTSATGAPAVKLMPRPASRQISLIWVAVGIMVVLVLLGGLAAAALMMSGVLRGGGGQVSPTPMPTPAPVVPQVFPTVTQLIVPVPPTAVLAPGGPTQTLIPTPQHTPTSTPAPTQPRLPTASPGARNTPSPVPSQMTPTVTCTGGRVWNGVECVCPPDRPDFLGGQCVPKGEGGGGDNEPPTPPR
jgi:hypothetical protein